MRLHLKKLGIQASENGVKKKSRNSMKQLDQPFYALG